MDNDELENLQFNEILLTIEYVNPLILPGFSNPIKYDYIKFDEIDEAIKYANSKTAYDYLDNTQKLNTQKERIIGVKFQNKEMGISEFGNQYVNNTKITTQKERILC